MGGVVVDDQRARVAARSWAARRVRGQHSHRNARGELAALARLTADAELAAQQMRELPGDCQTKPGAAEATRGTTVDLRKCFEQERLLRGADADAGVDHGQLELALFVA